MLCHTAEEVWGHLPRLEGDPESVHLALLPEPDAAWRDEELLRRYEVLFEVREAVYRALEQARQEKVIDVPAEARVVIAGAREEAARVLEALSRDLPELFLVAEVVVEPGPAAGTAGEGAGGPGQAAGQPARDPAVRVERTDLARCARCWRHVPGVGGDAAHPDLCPRCAAVVHQLEAAGA